MEAELQKLRETVERMYRSMSIIDVARAYRDYRGWLKGRAKT